MGQSMMRRPAVETEVRKRLLDETINRYVAWREECAGVEAGYQRWAEAREERAMRFAAYNAALDREEFAAELYARVVHRVGQLLWPGDEGSTSRSRAATS